MRKRPQSNGQEERIFVAVRIRPLNEKERTRHDVSLWECVSSKAIRFKNSLYEPSSPLDAYAFDKVFGDGCSTQQVYEGGIRQVVLSVVSGTNSSVFAYGQTSSGKTYTMTGITEYAVRDIYDYIEKNPDREFILKFSAMEIYNEIVRDLLSTNNTPLRLLDDPMKGTVIDKLKEEILTDWSHLQELLSICAAERTTKETFMNETSSRSHQILRLTIESSASHYVGKDKSGTLVASVSFVDLAGSERASQALTIGNRLREGAHINRSLLTLGTVIRKLSKGGNRHIPYRDSKLTRILQNSLGGNARTAIICTISPARSHVEQSKNTLLFASCAKQVATNAQVNVMMSDKVLVKHLQNELARLQNELRSFEPNTMLLKERELQIEQMEKEIKELTRQRDIFQSRIENCLQSVGNDQIFRAHKGSASKASDVTYNIHLDTNNRLEKFIGPDPFENSNNPRAVESFFNGQFFQESENPEDNFLLDGNTPEFFGPDPCQGWEEIASRVDAKYGDNCMEAQCLEGQKADLNMFLVSQDIGGKSPVRLVENGDAESSSRKEDNELTHVTVDKDQDVIQQKIQCVEDHKVDLTLFVPIAENVGGKSPMRFVENGDVESFSRKEDNELSLVTVDNHQEVLQQNIQCIEDHKVDLNMCVPVSNDIGPKSPMRLVENGDIESSSKKEDNELTPITVDNHQDVLQQKVEALQGTINHLVGLPEKYNGPSESFISQSGSSQLTRSKSWRSVLATTSHLQSDKLEYRFMLSPQLDKLEQKVGSPSQFDNLVKEPALPHMFNKPKEETIPSPTKVEKDYCTSLTSQEKFSGWEFQVKKRKSPKGHFQTHKMDAIDEVECVADSDTEDTASILNFVVKINGRSKTVPSKDIDNLMECERTSGFNELRKTRFTSFHGEPGALLPCEFERQQRYMVELWDAYNVPLVHRSYFFLLIKGELTDSVFLDVELRRLSFFTGNRITQDGQNLTPDSSLRALNREREMLSEKMHKFSRKEKEKYFLQWGIDLKSKNRSKQLAWRIWTNTKDMDHLRESATLVGKLIGLVESNETSKKTFGLKFLSLFKNRKSHSCEDMYSGM